MDFVTVFDQILLLFLLVLAGYGARWLGVFDDETTSGLCSLLVKVTLPALIISSMMVPFSPERLTACGEMLIISVVFYAISLVVAWELPRILRAPETDRGVYGFILMFSNTAFMGFPVIEAIFGKEALFYTAVFNLPFNLLVFSIGIIMLRWGAPGEKGHLDPKILLNPGIVSVIIGLILFVTSMRPPLPITGALESLGSLTTPLSMIVVGAMLARIDPAEVFAGWRVYAVTAARLLLMPVIVWAVLVPFVHDPYLLGVPVIMAAMPAAAFAAILAEECHADTRLASRGVFLSTLFCVGTIPFVALLVA
ncbi:AEC family transporter [Methanofollis aquaemaris]|uniref:AEC family transporter n=1 Tax=Methanofollis aquaemaris TaxID=126734 RepID=A0A8A3S5Z4_9EURY|nr:AEC family transporter [Methanofollis aquaemaris]QSZ67120.1 AEC family transporter [Methanofollis aquaemaris]